MASSTNRSGNVRSKIKAYKTALSLEVEGGKILFKLFVTEKNEEVINYLNQWGASEYKRIYDEVTEGISDRVKFLVDEWWNGKSVSNHLQGTYYAYPEYTKEEKEEAHSVVMTLISNGLG